MNELLLVYTGKDESFSEALAQAAKLVPIPYANIPTGRTVKINDDSIAVVLVIDADDRPFLAQAAQFKTDGPVLHVLAGWNQVLLAGLDGEQFADVLIKTHQPKLLAKRIKFYRNLLSPATNQYTDKLTRENHRLGQRVQQLQQELGRVDSDLHIRTGVIEKINHISRLFHQINCLDLDQIASVCIESIPQLIAARYASLYTIDEEVNVLHLLHHNHPYPINRLVVMKDHPTSPMTVAVTEQRLLLIKDFSEYSSSAKSKQDKRIRPGFARNYQSNSCIIAPLVSGGRTLGVLNLADKIDAKYFDDVSDLPPIELFCEILGSAMSNIKLYEEVCKQANTDGLTELLNHRNFYSELDKEVKRSQRYGGNLSLIMVDLDDLKSINDKYGHLAGDMLLKHVAQQLQKCIRNTDMAARYGGDEFAAILPNTPLEHAVIAGQRMVDMISATPIKVGPHKISISVSVGVSQYSPNNSAEGFMNESDAALFEAKAKGKNRVHVFDPISQLA